MNLETVNLETMSLDSGAAPSLNDDKLQDLSGMLAELLDHNAIWQNIRLSELPGKDYIFLPQSICNKLQQHSAIEAFVMNLQSFLDSAPGRIILVGYSGCELNDSDCHKQDLKGTKHIPQTTHRTQNTLAPQTYNDAYEKIAITWSDHVVMSWGKQRILATSEQFDFMQTLFQHSEALMS